MIVFYLYLLFSRNTTVLVLLCWLVVVKLAQFSKGTETTYEERTLTPSDTPLAKHSTQGEAVETQPPCDLHVSHVRGWLGKLSSSETQSRRHALYTCSSCSLQQWLIRGGGECVCTHRRDEQAPIFWIVSRTTQWSWGWAPSWDDDQRCEIGPVSLLKVCRSFPTAGKQYNTDQVTFRNLGRYTVLWN